MDYGPITIPAGTQLTSKTATGHDSHYHFVEDLSWISKRYPTIASILLHDAKYHGIQVPEDYVGMQLNNRDFQLYCYQNDNEAQTVARILTKQLDILKSMRVNEQVKVKLELLVDAEQPSVEMNKQLCAELFPFKFIKNTIYYTMFRHTDGNIYYANVRAYGMLQRFNRYFNK